MHNKAALCVQAACEWGLKPSQESLISSVVFVGTLSGAYAWGSLGDNKGRKLGFFATALFTVSFGLLSALAPSFGVGLRHTLTACQCSFVLCVVQCEDADPRFHALIPC